MRRLTTLLAMSTLILAITSAYLYLQLSAARERARRDAAHEGDLRGQVARLEQIRAGLETVLRASRPGQPLAAAPAISPSSAQRLTAAPPIASRPLPETLPASPPVLDLTEERRLWMQRRLNRSIFRELALSDAEVAAILPLLVQQQRRAAKPLPKGLTSHPQQESQRDQSELAAVIGAEKAERFVALRRLRPARNEITALSRRLEDSGEPLRAEQREELLGILTGPSAAVPPIIEGDDPQRSEAQLNAWGHELDQRVHEVLTAAQRLQLDEDDAYQNAMGRGRRAPAIVTPQAGSSASAARLP